MDNNKKVILINGDAGKWYEQVIFIVNGNQKNIPKNIVFEAEKIINEYISKKYNKSKPENINSSEIKNIESLNSKKNATKKISKKENKKIKGYLNIVIFLTVCIFFCLAYLIWF